MSRAVNRRMRWQILLAAGLCISGYPQQTPPAGQAPPLEPRPAAAPSIPERPVVLDVVVTDKSGAPIPGLQQQDFTLLDDKQPQPIVNFQASGESSDVPLQAILLMDAINTGFQGVAAQRTGIEKFLSTAGGKLPLPMSVMLLTDKTAVQSPVSQNSSDLAAALDSQDATLRTVTRSQGYYGAVERLQLSMKALEQVILNLQSQSGRKLLIWLGPGWPMLSGPNVQPTDKDRAWLFNAAVEFSAKLREARITLYTINSFGVQGSMQNEFYYEAFVKGVPSAKRIQSGNLAVQVLSVQSGGKVITMSNDLSDAITRCIADRKAFYTITFNAPTADYSNEYHSLQLKVDKSGLTARTRTGYYAQP